MVTIPTYRALFKYLMKTVKGIEVNDHNIDKFLAETHGKHGGVERTLGVLIYQLLKERDNKKGSKQ